MTDLIPRDAPSIAPRIIATATVCSSLATIFVALRIYTRLRINRSIGWDDYAALFALPFSIVYGILQIISTRYGAGLHTRDLPKSLVEPLTRTTFIGASVYLPSLLGYKMSILFLYLRIFSVSKVYRCCIWLVMFITFGYIFGNFWTQIFICQPIAKYWRPETPGYCRSLTAIIYAYTSLNFITDLLIFVLPLPMVWRMKLSLKEKLGVSMIFMLGSL